MLIKSRALFGQSYGEVEKKKLVWFTGEKCVCVSLHRHNDLVPHASVYEWIFGSSYKKHVSHHNRVGSAPPIVSGVLSVPGKHSLSSIILLWLLFKQDEPHEIKNLVSREPWNLWTFSIIVIRYSVNTSHFQSSAICIQSRSPLLAPMNFKYIMWNIFRKKWIRWNISMGNSCLIRKSKW